MVGRVGILFLAAGIAAQGATSFSWHTVDVPFRLPHGIEFVAHQRTRTSHQFDTLDQMRTGAIVRKSLGRITPYLGYYFQPAHLPTDDWVNGHRLFFGVEAPFQLTSRVRLVTRAATERFFSTGRPNYQRFRTYERFLFGRGTVVPFLQNELLFVAQGWHSMRNSAGLQIKAGPQFVFEAGFLYDRRRPEWGGDRAAFVTGIRWNPSAEK